MNIHIDQTPSNLDTHSDELQSVVLTRQNKRLTREILPFEVDHYQHQDELNLLLNITKPLKYHYFAVEQQPFLSLPEEASQDSRTAFLSYLIKVYGAHLTKGSIFFFVILTQTQLFLSYMTIF